MANNLQTSERTHPCRLCLTDKDNLYPIFDGGIPDLAEKIYDCTTVEINKIEGIPALICQLCRSKIVVCQQFVESCQRADRKFHRLYGTQFRQHKRFKRDLDNGIEDLQLSDSSSCSESEAQVVDRNGDNGKQLALPTKVPNRAVVNPVKTAVVVNPVKNAVMHRLMNDDKLRRYSIDDDRKVESNQMVKIPRYSEVTKQADTSIELIAAKIEQSLKYEDNQVDETGKRKCPKCGHLVLNLQKHMLLHSTLPKHVCGICNMTFERKCNLKYHVNLHTGEKPYKCLRCEASFSCPSRLWTHKQTHKENDNYRRGEDHRFHCNVCHSVFKHRKLIDQHMRTEHRERKHACETCGKAFFSRKNLVSHIKGVHKLANAK